MKGKGKKAKKPVCVVLNPLGLDRKVVDLEKHPIPDIWHISRAGRRLSTLDSKLIREVWYLAHNLKLHILTHS